MKSRNFLLHSLALELARVSEMLRQREPKAAEACEALLGIRRQLAAASGQDDSSSAEKPRRRQRQLLDQLISDTERLALMLVSEQAASEAASETFAEFRQAVVASAGERRKHLTDLSYLHSLSIGASETQPIVAELEDMFRRAGGTIVADYSEEHKADFDVSGSGQTIRVLRPAYTATNADGRTMLVARGLAESTAAENTAEAAKEMSTEAGAE